MEDITQRLLSSEEPSVRLKAQVEIVGQDPLSWETMLLHADVSTSQRVQTLLSERDASGRIPRHPYSKWLGAHWVLVMLALSSSVTSAKPVDVIQMPGCDPETMAAPPSTTSVRSATGL